jgi:hypothetical protein
MKIVQIFLVVALIGFFIACPVIALRAPADAPAPHANCCLCMCHAKDETKCSQMCIRLQHGKKIVELPEMNKCTKECKRVHVVPVKD